MMAHLFKRGRIWQAKVRLNEWHTEKKISLGTTDKRVAQSKLAALVSDFEMEAAGLQPSRPIREAREQPLESLCDTFLSGIKDDVSTATLKRYTSALRVVRSESKWTHLRHVTDSAFVDWRKHSGRRASTCNDYLAVWRQLLDSLKRQRMLHDNPLELLEGMPTAKSARDYRRALTEEEGLRLLATAPQGARCLCYRLMLETGIRPGELRRLRVADISFAGVFLVGGSPPLGAGEGAWGTGPSVRIPACISKNRKNALQPISAELATALRAYIPADAAGFALVFPRCVPKCATFYRDLACAGIARVDELGRRVDMHALRKTFGTHLVLAGVEPRVVMELMRHSDLKLTMKTYMDANQLTGPVLAAVTRLPWRNMPPAAKLA